MPPMAIVPIAHAGYHQAMRPVYTLAEAGEKDRELIGRYGLCEASLIDSAAMGAFRLAGSFLAGRIAIAVGPGNNGSDGIELAALLHRSGYDVSVLYLSPKGNAENMRRRKALDPAIPVVSSLAGFDTVVDALFGFGIDPSRTEYLEVVRDIPPKAAVIALDVPAGFSLKADATVCFMAPKAEMYLPSNRGKCGEILHFNPGFPEEGLCGGSIHLLGDDDSSIHQIGIADFKNTRGHVLAIGGSCRYPGALRLLCRSCFAVGAGLVTVLTDEKSVFTEHPSLIPYHGSDFAGFSSIAIGPGWDEGHRDIFDMAASSARPMAIDADALRFVPGHRFGWHAVLTPHVGEYRSLMKGLGLEDGLGDADSLVQSLRRASAMLEAVIVLKAASVWIADADGIYIYDGANPSLGVAGSGDVLAGIIGTLLAQGEEPLAAAMDGVILHQRAGRKAHAEYGYYPAEGLILEVGRLR